MVDSSGEVVAGNASVLGATSLQDQETLEITEATLVLVSGSPAPTGLDLIIVQLDGAAGASLSTILAGDGASTLAGETGNPLGSYQNTSGGEQTIGVAVDNGNYNAGTGSNQTVLGSAVYEVA